MQDAITDKHDLVGIHGGQRTGMKLLTYNIHHWEGVDGRVDVNRIAAVIAETGADLVSLNEVYHPAIGIDPHTSGAALSAMAQQLDMNLAFSPTVTTYLFPKAQPGEATTPFGNALLSRWPVLAHAGHHLTPVEGRETRGLLEARILLPSGESFTVYVTHLDHQVEAVRVTQWQAITTWTARDRSRPHVLLGDFNAHNPADYPTPERWQDLRNRVTASGYILEDPLVVPRIIKSGYVDAFAAVGQGRGETHSTVQPWGRIDYCFVSNALAPALVACRRWDSERVRQASDHFPLLTEISFP